MGTALIRSSLALGRFHTSVLAVPSCCLPSLLRGVQHPGGACATAPGHEDRPGCGDGEKPHEWNRDLNLNSMGQLQRAAGGQEGTAQCAQWCLCAFLRDDSILPHGC